MTVDEFLDEGVDNLPPVPENALGTGSELRGFIDSPELPQVLPGPLRPFAVDFIEAGRQFDLNPRTLAAISILETDSGKSKAFRIGQNAMGISDRRGPVPQSSVRDSIFKMARTLSNPRGPYAKANTLDEYGAIYAPPGAENDFNRTNSGWASGVRSHLSRLNQSFTPDPSMAGQGDTQKSIDAFLDEPKPFDADAFLDEPADPVEPNPIASDIAQQEGQKATMGALQALDVMAAPQSLDWSDVAQVNGHQLEQETREKFRLGQISEPEAMANFRRADEMRGITPEQRQQEVATAEEQAYQERVGSLSNNAIGRFLGPALQSQAGPVLESAARNIGPAIGGAGGSAMFMAPAAGPAGILFPLVGGMMGSMTGSMGQEALLRATETPEETQERQERWSQAEREAPIASGIGAMASNLPFFRPSPSTVGGAIMGNRSALKNVAAAAGIGAGAEIGAQIVGGQPLSPQSVAMAAISNILMSEPTRLGQRLGFKPTLDYTPQEIADASINGIQTPFNSKSGPRVSVPETGLTDRGTTSTSDVFANIRKPESIEIAGVKFSEERANDPNRITLTSKDSSGIKARFDYIRDADGVLRPAPGSGIEIFDPKLRGKGLGGEVTKWIANNKGPVGSSGITEEVTSPDAMKMWKRLESEGAVIEPRSEKALQDDLGEPQAYVLRPSAPEAPREVTPIQVEPGAFLPSGKKVEGFTLFSGPKDNPLSIIEAHKKKDGRFEVFNSQVSELERGKGHGVAIYERLLDETGSFDSDSAVTENAARVYDALERRGHIVERNPEADLVEMPLGGKQWRSRNSKEPVFRVTKKEQTLTPSDNNSRDPEPTGIRNSIVDARRRTSQMEAREIPARREFGTILDEAKAVHAQDPLAATRLVNELKENVRPLTDSEDALLTIEQNRRELVREEAIDAVNNAADETARDEALNRLKSAEDEAFEVYQVGQNAGTQNARGLNARRLMIQRDFSLAKMLNETRALRNGGEPLSEAQTKEITDLHARIADLEDKLATKENKDAQQAAKREYQDFLRSTKQEAQLAAKEKKSVVDFFESQAQKARERIIARRGRLQVTVDPLNLAGLVDEAIIGASHVARGVRDFAQWSKEMLKEFGSRIEPHLKPLWDRANQIESENAGAFKTKDTRNPEEVLANAKGLDRSLITDLARAHINQGVEGFEQVIGAVENDLKTQFPDVTTRQIHDALSGYGKTTKPSQAEDLKKLREYRSLARLTSQLEDAQKGINPLKTGPQRDKATARVRELQKQVNDAIEKAGLKRTREDQLASSLDAAKTRIKNATEELKRKIDRKDYTERPKREQQVDKERIDLEFELSKVKQEYQKGLIEARRARRTTGEKIWDTTKETFNLSRQLLTSGDLPPVFRQGLFSIGRPKMAARALVDSLQAMFSEKKRFAVDREIQNRPNAPLYERAKLYLAKEGSQTLSQQEEAYMGNWFKEMNFGTGKNLPITPVGRALVRTASGVTGAFLRASERSYNTFLNKLRADTFDAAVKSYEIAPTDTKNLRALADVINTMTGRAKLPGKALEQGAGALNTFLFAPRFLASRFKLATGQPLWSGTGTSRKFALEQYARTLAGAALIYGLAKKAGAEIETDPRSTDFGKIRFGKTRLDPLGGLSQITTFLTRLTTGQRKNEKGKIEELRGDKKSGASMGQMIGSFARTKLNPVAGATVDLATGKDVTGNPVTPGGLAYRMAVPISFQDIQDTMVQQGVPKGTAMWILSLFGMGLQTYGQRK